MSQTDKTAFFLKKRTVIRDLDCDRLVNIPGEISAIDVFADFITELVLVQKFTHGLLGAKPNHATRARDCKERGGREQYRMFFYLKTLFCVFLQNSLK